jgi:hypothetical protein
MKNSTPAAVEHYQTNPPDYGRPAYIGIAAHAATFEPEDFLRTYITAPDWEGRPRNKTTKNGGCKEEWDAWKLENQDKEILSHDEYHGAINGEAPCSLGNPLKWSRRTILRGGNQWGPM